MDKKISNFIREEYIRLILSRLGLPSEYDYWLAEYSPIIPQKSITTNNYVVGVTIYPKNPKVQTRLMVPISTPVFWAR